MQVPNNLMDMARKLNELYELSYNQIKPQVTYIIKNNIKDIKKIKKDIQIFKNKNKKKKKIIKEFQKFCKSELKDI